jgi:hypothetical protein
MLVPVVGRTIGWFAAVLVGFMFTFNGIVMLVSPKAWFRIPPWLAGRGTMTEQKYSTRNGALQVRALGAIFIAGVAYVLISLFRE